MEYCTGSTPIAVATHRECRWIALAMSLVAAAGVAGCAQSSARTETTTLTTRSAARDVGMLGMPAGRQPLVTAETLRRLTEAELRHREISAAGGWPQVPAARGIVGQGSTAERNLLARRLAASGDLPATGGSIGPGELAAGVRAFQARHGLSASGDTDRATIEALNVPVETRVAEIQSSIRSIRSALTAVGRSSRHVVVNIPGYYLEAVDGGAVARRHRVVVGRPDRPTPSVETQIQRVNFAPFWHVPESIARRDLVPTLQKDPEYLIRERIRVYRDPRWQSELAPSSLDWRAVEGLPLHFRQDPGPWNALGLVRLDMPNAHTVYLHDTPLKDLFGRADRSFSAGCVRVEDMAGLATWILEGTPGWGPDQVRAAITEQRQVDVPLARPVPVVFLYATAWPAADGRIEFRRDIYRRGPADEVAEPRGATTVARLAP